MVLVPPYLVHRVAIDGAENALGGKERHVGVPELKCFGVLAWRRAPSGERLEGVGGAKVGPLAIERGPALHYLCVGWVQTPTRV